jgi:hypothetical protein
MSRPRNILGTVAILSALLVAVNCSSGSAELKILEQRERWSVQLLSWAESADGGINIATRVAGPPNSPLAQLTVAIVLQDGEGRTVERVWHTFDLSEVPRGGPSDLMIHLPASDGRQGTIEGIGIDGVFEPKPEDRPHIPELAAS